MAIKERKQQMRVVAEILLVHLPEVIDKDQALAHDLLAVVGTSLNTIYEDAEKSAKAWDKRAYDVKSDELRRKWDWTLGASNYALGMALRSDPVTKLSLKKMRIVISPELERPARRQIKDPARFRGAAKLVREQQARKRKPIRG